MSTLTLCLGFLILGSQPAGQQSLLSSLEILEDRGQPSTLTVLNNLDKGQGSLRETIAHAKSGDTIVFSPSLHGQTIVLTSGELEIKESLEIEGPGADLLAISGNDTSRVFDIHDGLTVTIAGLTITHGRGGGRGGGAISNVGSTLILANDVLSDNVVVGGGGGNKADGGAVHNYRGILIVRDSLFRNNQALGDDHGGGWGRGGAIFNLDGSQTTVARSTFVGNLAAGGNGGIGSGANLWLGLATGGAITNQRGSMLAIEDSTFTRNQAIGGSGGLADGPGALGDLGAGGAIMNHDNSTLIVRRSTFSQNQAIGGSNATLHSDANADVGDGQGGGLFNEGKATLESTIFDNNQALGGNGNSGSGGVFIIGMGIGGGIANSGYDRGPAQLYLTNCTLTNNRAGGGSDNSGSAFVGAGLGGALSNGFANFLPTFAAVTNCTIANNQAFGGQGLAGSDGGNGLAGGIYNYGQSTSVGTAATLTVLNSTITANEASGGAAVAGGNAGLGQGGGFYLDAGGIACVDLFTIISGNHASTSDDDVFGTFCFI
jgi:hypothetical protein